MLQHRMKLQENSQPLSFRVEIAKLELLFLFTPLECISEQENYTQGKREGNSAMWFVSIKFWCRIAVHHFNQWMILLQTAISWIWHLFFYIFCKYFGKCLHACFHPQPVGEVLPCRILCSSVSSLLLLLLLLLSFSFLSSLSCPFGFPLC